MTVRELIAELQGMDPEAEVRFFHLRRVMRDGSGRVGSYPVVEVAAGDGAVTLSDFVCQGTCLFKVNEVEWEQPALKGPEVADEDEHQDEEEEREPQPGGMLSTGESPEDSPVDTLLVDPPFTREEWSGISVGDVGKDDSPVGQRVMAYIRHYHRAVMGANHLHDLIGAAGLPVGSDLPFDEGLLLGVLQRLFERRDSTVHGLEVMMAAVEFANFLQDERAVALGPETLDWLGKVESLVVLTLVVCVNRYFGLVR